MLKDEILKMVDEIKGAPGVRNVITLEYPDGRWVPMIMVVKEDGKLTILKKQKLSSQDENEAVEAMSKYIISLGSEIENVRYHQTH